MKFDSYIHQATLHNCEPHFVRCLVPNTHKKPGEVEPPLIMHQLTCNGVLEGIRICMRGFPNRMLYPDYKMRYACLGQKEIESSSDNKTASYALMDKISFGRERYRLGHTLVFFRAGALAFLEVKLRFASLHCLSHSFIQSPACQCITLGHCDNILSLGPC